MNDVAFQIAPDDLQFNVLRSYDEACCARVAFLHFRDQASARAWAAVSHERCFHGHRPLNVAFSASGLQALGCTAAELAAFPDAFRQGMAARASRLGDPPGASALVPPWLARDASADGPAWQPGALHALAIVFLRHDQVSPAVRELLRQLGRDAHAQAVQMEPMAELERALAATLDAAWEDLHLPLAGVDQLGHQDLHHPLIEQQDSEQRSVLRPVEYFGFRDGVSQPALYGAGGGLNLQALQQFVLARTEPLLAKGSFLVLRQLEQDPQRFWRQLGGSRALAEQIVGRAMDGSELPAQPAGCPFHSHARRVNPDIDPGANPRILRRGMSYTQQGACGLMFMAINADIEAQFEFIQRNWVQRGNQAGLLSAHCDPVAGMSGPTPFVAIDDGGQQNLVSLQSCVSLKWGEYFFMPAHDALQRLGSQVTDAVAEQLVATLDPAQQDQLVAHWLDDARTAGELWRHVRDECGGVARIGTHVLVGDQRAMNELCPVGKPSALSVAQYRERMADSTGPFMLGMDAETPAYRHEHPAVAIIPTDPFELTAVIKWTAGAVTKLCASAVELAKPLTAVPAGQTITVPLDLNVVLAGTLSAVLGRFFGLPGPNLAALLKWSNDIARLHFRIAPNAADHAKAQLAASQFRAYIGHAIAEARALHGKAPAGSPPAVLFNKIEHIKAALRQDELASDEDAARIILGICTGSLTAVAFLFKEAFVPYAVGCPNRTLVWPQPPPASPPGAPPSLWLYEGVIRNTAFHTGRGGPDALVRTYRGEARELNGVQLQAGTPVMVWLGGAAQQTHDDAYLFGINDGHRCPGLEMGKAILQGILEALSALRGLRMVGDGFVFDVIAAAQRAP